MPRSAATAIRPADPLAGYRHLAKDAAGRPIPLKATRFSVRILGGLALVEAERTFRNDEEASIEATLTFPVPIHAALVALTAKLDGRTLAARAQRREAARETYESGIAEGRTAVLHEEVLRGVHMISVGQVRPGGEVTVTGLFAVPLAAAPGDRASLRIPTTAGDVYGRSPLQDSDDLAHGPYVHEADLEISCLNPGVSAVLAGGHLQGGRTRVRLDAPIEISVSGVALDVPLRGTAADGRTVELLISPAPTGEADLDADWLLDISGSMDEPAHGRDEGRCGPTKFDVTCRAVAEAASRLRATDRVALWEFNTAARRVGRATGPANVLSLIDRISDPGGGTEVGDAINACLREREDGEILILTDGKSYALDVHAAARRGARFTVLLVGEDALAANVGHLAALTGGQLFLSSGPDLPGILELAIASMRVPRAGVVGTGSSTLPAAAQTVAGGMAVTAHWGQAAEQKAERDRPSPWQGSERAIAAYAAWLALPAMEREAAATLAEAEGIVSHLTSLVLVDSCGEAQDGIPAQRKVTLSTPRTVLSAAAFDYAMPHFCLPSPSVPAQSDQIRASSRRARAGQGLFRVTTGFAKDMGAIPSFLRRKPSRSARPRNVCGRIPWGAEPEQLRKGDLSGLPADVTRILLEMAGEGSVLSLAAAVGVAPIVAALAMVARVDGVRDRAALRFADAILASADPALVQQAMKRLGL
jgi:hypothetical protein